MEDCARRITRELGNLKTPALRPRVYVTVLLTLQTIGSMTLIKANRLNAKKAAV